MRPSTYNALRRARNRKAQEWRMTMQKWDSVIRRMVNAKIFPQVLHRILLSGISHAGKSTIGETLFSNGFEAVACHRDMTCDDLIGGMSLVDGSTKWLDGAALRALRQGKLVIFNEIDQRSPECTSYFHCLLDGKPAVTIPTGERVVAAPGYCVIATTNALPSELPIPFFNRFDVILKVTELSEDLTKVLGKFATPAKNAAAKAAKKYAAWQRPAGISMWLAAAKLKQHHYSDEQIADFLGLVEQEKVDFLTAIAER